MKRGVFGNKATPMDAVPSPERIPRPKEVTIKALNGGFHVRISPKTKDEYQDTEHVAKTLSAAMKIAKEHFGVADAESKDEK